MSQDVLKFFDDYKFAACIRSSSASDADEMIQAAIDGGIRIFEISVATPQAFKMIENYAKKDSLLIGAGNIPDGEVAQRAINSGAAFVACNYTDREVINVARHNDSFSIQGISTPTEAFLAQHYGADCVKLFPATLLGGADFLRALRDQLPSVKFTAEGGIDSGNAFEFLKHGIGAFLDKALFDKQLIRQNNWSEITQRAKKLTQRLESLKLAK